jgi:hypothetical protein
MTVSDLGSRLAACLRRTWKVEHLCFGDRINGSSSSSLPVPAVPDVARPGDRLLRLETARHVKPSRIGIDLPSIPRSQCTRSASVGTRRRFGILFDCVASEEKHDRDG